MWVKMPIITIIDKVVDETGEKNVVQVVTDNEPARRAGGKLLM